MDTQQKWEQRGSPCPRKLTPQGLAALGVVADASKVFNTQGWKQKFSCTLEIFCNLMVREKKLKM